MGNNNEGYLGGIMGGESRVGSISLDGNKLAGTSILDWTDSGGSYGSSTSTAMVKTGDSWDLLSYDISGFTDGFVCIEMYLPADTAHRAGGIGYSNGATLTGVVGSAVGAAGMRRQIGSSTVAQVSTAAFSTSNATFHDYGAHPVVFQLLIECSTSKAWLSYGEAGGATRYWVTGQNTRATAFDYNSPLDASTVITELHAQNYYGGTTSYVNTGADGTFGGQTSDNDTSEWFWDIPTEIKGSGGSVTGLKNTGILSLEEAGTQAASYSTSVNKLEGTSVLDWTDAGNRYSTSTSTQVIKSGAGDWNRLDYDISSFTDGFVCVEVLWDGTSASQFAALGYSDGSTMTGAPGAVAGAASIRHISSTTLDTYDVLSGVKSSTLSASSYPIVAQLLIECSSGKAWMSFGTADGSDRKWLTSRSTTVSAFDYNNPLDATTVITNIQLHSYNSGNSFYVNTGADGTFGGQTALNDTADWFWDIPAEISVSGTKTLPQLSWGGITGRSVLTEGSAAVPGDDNWNDVSLLIRGDTLTDLSANGHTLTASGNAAAGDADTKYASGSLSFDGVNDGIDVTASNLPVPADGGFTIEAWLKWGTATPSTSMTVAAYGDPTATKACGLRSNSTNGYTSYFWSADLTTGDITTGANAVTLTDWHHVAVTFDGTTRTIWVNGVSRASDTPTWTLTTNDNLSIGYRSADLLGPTHYWNGNIEDFRITKGVARYTSNFTPPTESFPTNAPSGTPGDDNWDDVTLLLDGSDPTNNLKSGGATVTNPNSDVSTTTTDPGSHPYATDFLEFNSDAADKLTIAESDTGVAFGTDDFTFEAWIYLPSGELGTSRALFDGRDGSNPAALFYIRNTGELRLNLNGDQITGGTALTEQTWHHVALTVENNIAKVFLDGTQTGSSWDSTASAYNSFTPTADFQIGHKAYSGSSIAHFHGYMADIRITKGVARYTSNFTPPTESFPTSLLGTSSTQSLVNTGIFTLEEIYELTKAVPQVDFATGGTVSDINVSGQDYRVHLFTTSGTFTVNTALTDVEYLVIGGGGAGGYGGGGGGGAGGYRCSVSGENSGGGSSAEATLSLPVGDHTITVGAGGTYVSGGGGFSGSSSSIGAYVTASGGGYGSEPGLNAATGGSGGGGRFNQTGGSGTANEGYAGGGTAGNYTASGGGGAGGAGSTGTTAASGDGGAGITSSITGTAITRAGGGGGGADYFRSDPPGSGGSGGGGDGVNYDDAATANHGEANTGGGGGGGSNRPDGTAAQLAGDGGSGVVIIRYKI